MLLQQELVMHQKSDLTTLIHHTFPTRQQLILDETMPVKEITAEYLHLSKPVHVNIIS